MAKKTTEGKVKKEVATEATTKKQDYDVEYVEPTEYRVGFHIIRAEGIALQVEANYIFITQYDSGCDVKSASKALQKVTDKRVSLSEDGRFTVDGKELSEWKTSCVY
jgi:hypothetical protein